MEAIPEISLIDLSIPQQLCKELFELYNTKGGTLSSVEVRSPDSASLLKIFPRDDELIIKVFEPHYLFKKSQAANSDIKLEDGGSAYQLKCLIPFDRYSITENIGERDNDSPLFPDFLQQSAFPDNLAADDSQLSSVIQDASDLLMDCTDIKIEPLDQDEAAKENNTEKSVENVKEAESAQEDTTPIRRQPRRGKSKYKRGASPDESETDTKPKKKQKIVTKKKRPLRGKAKGRKKKASKQDSSDNEDEQEEEGDENVKEDLKNGKTIKENAKKNTVQSTKRQRGAKSAEEKPESGEEKFDETESAKDVLTNDDEAAPMEQSSEENTENTSDMPTVNYAIKGRPKKSSTVRNPATNKLECKYCQRQYDSIAALGNHVSMNHTDREDYRVFIGEVLGVPYDNLFVCEFCSFIYRQIHILRRHVRTEHRYEEEFESYMTRLGGKVVIPEEDQYDEASMVKCAFCPMAHMVGFNVYEHMKAKHEDEPSYKVQLETLKKKIEVKCPLCEKIFINPKFKYGHLKLTHANEVHRCEKCGAVFKNKYLLRGHVKAQHDETQVRFMCDRCPSTFSTANHLRQHVKQIHLKTSQISCPECNKVLSSANALKVHTDMVHKKIKRHICEFCAKEFYSGKALRDHVKVVHELGKQTELFPNECHVCSRRFADRRNMKKHIQQVHNKVYPFTCQICNKGFPQGKGFRDHVVKHHPPLADKVEQDHKVKVISSEDLAKATVTYQAPVHAQVEMGPSMDHNIHGSNDVQFPVLHTAMQGAMLEHPTTTALLTMSSPSFLPSDHIQLETNTDPLGNVYQYYVHPNDGNL